MCLFDYGWLSVVLFVGLLLLRLRCCCLIVLLCSLMLWVYLVSWWADYLSLLLFLLAYCDCVLFGVWLCLLGVRIALGLLVICVRCDDFFWLGCFGVSINSVVVTVCI